MTKIRLIVLDFDGVLVESSAAKLSAFKDLFALYTPYHDAMMDYHLANYSSPRMMKFEYYVYDLMQRPGDIDAVKVMADQFSEFVVQRVIACPEVPGAREFLDEFSHQVPLYVSSVTPESELRSIIHARVPIRYQGMGPFQQQSHRMPAQAQSLVDQPGRVR